MNPPHSGWSPAWRSAFLLRVLGGNMPGSAGNSEEDKGEVRGAWGKAPTTAPGPGQKLWEDMLILKTHPGSHPWAGAPALHHASEWPFAEWLGQQPGSSGP